MPRYHVFRPGSNILQGSFSKPTDAEAIEHFGKIPHYVGMDLVNAERPGRELNKPKDLDIRAVIEDMEDEFSHGGVVRRPTHNDK